MGAWGIGILEDDTAADFMDELRAEERPMERARQALEEGVRAAYLDYCAGRDPEPGRLR